MCVVEAEGPGPVWGSEEVTFQCGEEEQETARPRGSSKRALRPETPRPELVFSSRP